MRRHIGHHMTTINLARVVSALALLLRVSIRSQGSRGCVRGVEQVPAVSARRGLLQSMRDLRALCREDELACRMPLAGLPAGPET